MDLVERRRHEGDGSHARKSGELGNSELSLSFCRHFWGRERIQGCNRQDGGRQGRLRDGERDKTDGLIYFANWHVISATLSLSQMRVRHTLSPPK